MKFDHIALNCKSVSRSVDWYMRNLQARVLYEDTTWALLEIGGQRIALTVPEQHPAHMAFDVGEFDKFPDGSEIKFHRDGSMYCYVSDPDNNTIEYIYWPKETENERDNEATEKMEDWESV